MGRLHEDAIVASGSPFLPAPAPMLVEPLRITLDSLDLESLSKLWTAASRPLRLSVGYTVSLVVAEQRRRHRPGPPVQVARVLTVPSAGPRLRGLLPARVGADAEAEVTVDGITAGIAFLLAADPGDPSPAPPGGWPLTVVRRTRDGFVLRLPRHDLAPGVRRADVVASTDGVVVGGDSIALTVVPTVLGNTTPVVAGQPVTLTTAHCGSETEVFVDATSVAPAAVESTAVTFVVPSGLAGRHALSLRSGRVAGPPYDLEVAA